MENFELIEKYIAGQLEGAEREAFERQLQADASLQSDVSLQKQIVEGIKKSRAAQLKNMLNQVPVTPAMQGGVSSMQIISGVVTVAFIAAGTLFYVKPWEKKKAVTVVIKQLPPPKTTIPEVAKVAPVEEKSTSPLPETSKAVRKITAPVKAKAAHPKIEVVDPTNELTREPSVPKEKTDDAKSSIVASRIAVETNSTNEKYSFHYQFSQGKLILYGNFDNGLYEILEVNGDKHSVFLYYKDAYYPLNEHQTSITPLAAIKDVELIGKLKAYRGQ